LKCKSSVPRLKRPVTMSIFRCRWQRRLDWRAGRKFSGNCWSGVNYAWCDLRFQPPAKIGRSQRSVKVGFDTLSWASHPSESGNSPLKSGLSLHLLAGHHEIIGLGQHLVVTSGCGWVQRWGGPIEEIRPGDVVRIPPGEKHWHGAAPNTAMTHIAVYEFIDGNGAEWMEAVSDQPYRK